MSAVSHLPAPVEMRLRFRARPAELRGVRARVSEAARRCGCTESCVDDVVRAVDEACQNVIRHAYGGDRIGEVVLRVEREGAELVFSLIDFAEPVCMPSGDKPTIARSLGAFVGHIWRGVTTNAEDASRTTEVRRDVEESVEETDEATIIARRTTIEEVEVRPKGRDDEPE